MKCPSLIKKKTCGAELQTKRTLANGAEVRRERVCPKCHARFWTVEQFEKDLAAANFQHQEQIRSLDNKILEISVQLEEHFDIFRGFRKLMDKAAGTLIKEGRGGR